MRPTPQLPTLEVYMLGLVDFLEVQQLQRRIVYDLGEQGGAALILCEHPPTISVGRAGSRAHIGPDDDALRSLGIKVHWVNRGGGCVFHLPGSSQPILPCRSNRPGSLSVTMSIACTRPSCWCSRNSTSPGHFARVSPACSRDRHVSPRSASAVTRWIAYHGLTINVGPYLELFDVLDEPVNGHAPIRHTSMEARRQRHTAMAKVREALIRRLEEVFGLERHHVYTKHPMVRGKVFSHVYAPAPG